jgi:predicted ATPase/DNA-binding SARP family transcriptional activator
MQFAILGPLEVRDEQGPIALGGPKLRALLAVLLLHANQPVRADRLAVALWGDEAPASAVKTVQVYVSRLRTALRDPDVLRATPAGYRLRVRADELDAERFARLVADGRRTLAEGRAGEAALLLRQALGFWRGEALPELAFAPFAQAEVQRLDEQRLAALESRLQAELADGRHNTLVGELRQLVATYPTRERFVSQLMLALYRSGQQVEALECYRRGRASLAEELGLEPGRELRELHQAILLQDRALDAPPVPEAPAAERTAGLPVASTALFGRTGDVDAVRALIGDKKGRLVSLIGPGGVGKTRLAIEAARSLSAEFTDGARFVSLATVAEPRDLAAAVSNQLSAPVRPGESPAATVHRYLSSRHLLLVLDNFEHLLPGAAIVRELLVACPQLTIVVTSREPLDLSAERLYPVRPLEVPGADRAPVAELARCGAVAMFVDRARARDPSFALNETNATHVGEVCRRLDGLPLALELAAARLALLSPAELATRLDRALAVLGGGARDAPARQRTLRATIDWSYRLLSSDEREAFARFAVFATGPTVDAAEKVTEASVDSLHSLVAKQLLIRDGDRLRMLETVREYAGERLAEDAHAADVHERLASWCLRFASEVTPHLVTREQPKQLRRLEAELPNLLAALSWALEHERGEVAVRLSGVLAEYWFRSSRWRHGLHWIDAALELGRDASPSARGTALLYRALLVGVREDGDRHRADMETSLECFRACDDAIGIASCLGNLASAEAWYGRFEQASKLSEEAWRVAGRVQDQGAIAVLLKQRALAISAYEDQARAARAALDALRGVGNIQELAHLCLVIGYLAVVERRYGEAIEWLDEGLGAGRELDHPVLVFHLRSNQGLAWLFLDELDEAAAAFREALTVCRDASCEDVVDETLVGLAAVAARCGEAGRAAQLAGAAVRHKTVTQSPSELALRERLLDEILTPARVAGASDEWDRASAEGASLTVYEAIDLGLRRGRFAPTTATSRSERVQRPRRGC